MTGRIITARHGRPDLSRDVTITAREYGDWWARYDESGLHPDERPPEGLMALASTATTVLSSSLPRAIETAAQATGGARTIPADPMFVEAPLPPPPWPDFVKLRPGVWGVVSRVLWNCGYAPAGVEHRRETWLRVEEIVSRLEAHAAKGDVLLCAHGYLNWMIDRRLQREGWARTERDGGNHYWSWRVYEPAGEKSAVGAVVAE